MDIFEKYESNVRSYCRKFTDTFETAEGSVITDKKGVKHLDFFSGAGALNYGHANPEIIGPVIKYMQRGGIIHALDMHTVAKEAFIECFEQNILQPRGMDHKIMFCGPSGTNAVESALKLARKNTGRRGIFAFSGGFHGMSMGSMSVTSDRAIRNSAGVPLYNTTYLPYPSKEYVGFDTIAYMEAIMNDDHSGIDKPAAIILETVQAEGGINVAPVEFLQKLRAFCDKYGVLLITDEIQIGCWRTGPFFSFERAGIIPDMITLSKSISGGGFPMALMLVRPELDIFTPGEHNGTFRGFNPAFVGAKAAIEFSMKNDMTEMVEHKNKLITDRLRELTEYDGRLDVRGIGLIIGIDFSGIRDGLALECCRKCYEKGLIIELAGRRDNVLKLMPPLTTPDDLIQKGCDIIIETVKDVIAAVGIND